jgi:hypothetical protein
VHAVRQPGLSCDAIEAKAFMVFLPRAIDVEMSIRGLDEGVEALNCRWGDVLPVTSPMFFFGIINKDEGPPVCRQVQPSGRWPMFWNSPEAG